MERLVSCGVSNQRAVLGFCQTALLAVDRAAHNVSNKEEVWRMWSVVVHPLLEHVTKVSCVGFPAKMYILPSLGVCSL